MSKVYFARSGARIKIGIARNVERRLLDIGNHLPEQIALIGTTPGGRGLEQLIHRELALHRLRGEWFSDCPEVRKVVARYVAAPVRDWIFLDRKPSPVPVIASNFIISLMARARQQWPQKTAEHIAACTNGSVRSAKYWLAGKKQPSANSVHLLQKEMEKNS